MSDPKRYASRYKIGQSKANGVEFDEYAVYDLPESIYGDYVRYEDYAALKAEVQVLLAKVEWLQKADRLVVWTGTEWQIRHELDGKTEVAK